jgi:hypothetical protein
MIENGLKIYVVSDSVGETAEQVVKAAVIQFNSDITEIRKEPFITDKYQIKKVIEEASQHKCVAVSYPSTSLSVSAKWCGVASAVTLMPSAFALRIISTEFLVLTWAICTLQPV